MCENGTVVADPTNNAELVADCKVLLEWEDQLRYSSRDPGLNWTDSSRAITDWEGITVGGDPKRVPGLTLPTNSTVGRLFGNLTDGLESLTGLTHLNLSRNQLSGSIPVTIGNLTNLVSLNLNNNQFSGQIPTTIGNLTTLTYLDLSDNNFTGSIPAEIWRLTNLVALRLYDNKGWRDQYGLTGEIPPEVKNLQSLEVLALHINKLSGSIPAEIAELPVLKGLYLYENEFTGSIPSALGDLPKLGTLDLRYNQLTGQIPTQLEDLLPGLENLDLTGNSFSDCVPANLLKVPYNDLDYLMEYLGLPLCGTSTNTNLAPSISSATVDGATLTLTYNEALDTGSQPATRGYTVTVNDSTSDHAVTSVLVGGTTGTTVTLTLDPAVVAGDTVLVSYTPDTSPVQDSDGAKAGALTDHLVTNNTTPAPPVYQIGSGVVDGDTLTLTYSEDLDPNSKPETTTYTVTADSTTHTVRDVAISGVTVTLTLTTPVQRGQTVRLSYVPPSTDPLQDLDGEDAALLRNVSITNNTDVPPGLVSAEVDGDTLTLTYSKDLDETSQPDIAAYTVTVDTVGREVTGVVVSGRTVTLTLATAVVGGETVLVSYDAPQTEPVQDTSTSRTAAAVLSDEPVENITNNSPVFSTMALTVAENTQVVGMVVAEDPDIQDNVTYILKAADPGPEDDGRIFAITSAGVLSFRESHGATTNTPSASTTATTIA